MEIEVPLMYTSMLFVMKRPDGRFWGESGKPTFAVSTSNPWRALAVVFCCVQVIFYTGSFVKAWTAITSMYLFC